MKCDKCGYDDNGTGDFAHVCRKIVTHQTTGLDAKIVEQHIRSIYATWHCCAMPMHKVKAGSKSSKSVLCDDCEDNVKAHLKEIRREMQEKSK